MTLFKFTRLLEWKRAFRASDTLENRKTDTSVRDVLAKPSHKRLKRAWSYPHAPPSWINLGDAQTNNAVIRQDIQQQSRVFLGRTAAAAAKQDASKLAHTHRHTHTHDVHHRY
jgi:hypothetical protein